MTPESDPPDFRALFEAHPDRELILTPDLRIVAVSDAYARATLIRREEVLGRCLSVVFPDTPDHPNATGSRGLRASLDRVLATRDADTIPAQLFDVRRADGGFDQHVWRVRHCPVLTPDGSVRWIVQRLEDESAGVPLPQPAAGQLRILEACIARLSDMVLVTRAEPLDEPGPVIVYANDAFLRNTGYEREEVIGRTPRFLQGADTSRTELDRVRQALRLRQPVRAELVNYTKDGRPFLVELEIAPVPDAAGRVTHFVAVHRDVTVRHKAAEALRAREAQLLSFVRHAPVVMAMFDRGMNYLAASERWVVTYGRGHADLTGINDYDLRPDLPERWREVHRRALAGEELAAAEDVWHPPGGTAQWLNWAVRPWHELDGTVGGVVVVTEDITPRKLAEEALHDREVRLAAVLTTAADAIITIDEQGIIESLNPAAERLFGYSRAELVGRNVSTLTPSPFSEEYDGNLTRYAATGGQRIIGIGRETLGRRKDGTVFPIDLSVSEVVDGRRWFTGIIRDASERKRTEARLREQAELLDKVTNAVIVRSAGGRVTYWNRGAEELYGWTAAEATGRDDRPAWTDDPPTREALLADGRWDGELTHTTKDGRTVVVESHQSLLRAADGGAAGVIAIHIDVTERKQLEQRLLRAQRLESIGALASGIAHDLNNVLTPVLMVVKLLLKDRPGLDRQTLLETAQASVERGTAMIRQLLTFGGRTTSDQVSVSIPDLLREVRGMLDHILPQSVTLRIDVPAGVWPVTGDATQLTQVLINLCVNARDAMPGGGTITITIGNVTLDSRRAGLQPGANPGRYVVLTVTDTGHGIRPEVQQRIFDPFFTTKPFGQGTGLGLATTLGIVKGHGGFIGVYSEPGKGARFQVHLPAAITADAEESVPTGVATPVGHGELILVADDESQLRTVTAAVLTSAGYRVVTATNGDEAVEVYRRQAGEVAAAVLDMMMPGTGGVAALRRIREISPNPRVVVVSGLRPTAAEAVFLSECGAEFLLKPYSDDDLLAAIRSVMAPRR